MTDLYDSNYQRVDTFGEKTGHAGEGGVKGGRERSRLVTLFVR